MAPSPTQEDIESTVKRYILEEFLPGENPAELTASTPLITSKILDSIATLKLVAFLEQQYGIEIEAHEADFENLDSLARIAVFVRSKL
jgi:acyl carrier protein